MKKSNVILITITILSTLASCSSQPSATKVTPQVISTSTSVSQVAAIQLTPTPYPIQPELAPTDIVGLEAFKPLPQEEIDLSSFKHFKKVMKNYNLKKLPEGDEYKPSQFTGSYDLNGDGKEDKISIEPTRSGEGNDNIVINQAKTGQYFDNVYHCYIIDLDSRDRYTELAIYDDGPSGDPHTIFYRYTGSKVIKLGELYGDPEVNGYSFTYGPILLDGKGKLISSGGILGGVTTPFCYGVNEIINNKLVGRAFQTKPFQNRTYTLSEDLEAYFIPMEKVPNDLLSVLKYEQEKQIQYRKGAKLKIYTFLDCGSFFVEELDGRKGLLYFFMGD